MTVGLCECGCGSPAPIATTTYSAKGWVKGQPKRFIQGHNARGHGALYGCPKARFWAKVKKTDLCWLWTGATRRGYGQFYLNGKQEQAHRVAYEMCVGLIPEGLEVDHLCRNRPCVNPEHLEPVTHRENGARGISPHGVNARKTHCVHGHEFTPENTYVRADGRQCRTCQRAWQRRLKAAKRAERQEAA